LIVSDESRFVGLAIVRPCVHSEAGFSRTAADVSRHIIQVMPENTEFFGRCRTIADDYKRPPSPPPFALRATVAGHTVTRRANGVARSSARSVGELLPIVVRLFS
jgi:hypothetical protein